MKVKELIEELERLNPDFEVRVFSSPEKETVDADGIAVFPKEKAVVIREG